MSTSRIISKVVLFSLVLALSLTVSWAGTLEGSSTTARSFTDSALGQVMIYNGGFFDNGNTVTTFNVFDSNFGQGAKFITPILFEETSTGTFVVRGIGTTDTINPGASPQAFAFGLVNGIGTTSSGLFTFGFIEAAVNSNGVQTTSSTGGADGNTPPDAPPGIAGGGTTNDWVFTATPGSGNVTVTLGKKFFIPFVGSGDYQLNNPAGGGFSQDRTYSANLNSAASAVPEPGTLTLFTSGAGLLLAGLLRFRRRS